METTRRIDKFVIPLGRQEIELLQVDYEAGGLPLLRLRMREGHRHTIFEIDADSARRWGEALLAWARSQDAAPPIPQPMNREAT